MAMNESTFGDDAPVLAVSEAELNDKTSIELTRLLDGITNENLHPSIDLGRPVGKEAL